MKMKRKDLDGVNDDFSAVSLLSPARKSRRLDADLPPIMEEEEAIPLAFEQSLTEESPSVPSVNEERALTIFNPINPPSPLFQSPANFSVAVDSDIISGFKNFWARQANCVQPTEDEVTTANGNSLAIVPWVPSQDSQVPVLQDPQAEATELMEADEMETANMEVESNGGGPSVSFSEFGGVRGGNGSELPQWLQQHCMTLQVPLSTSAPVVWYQ